MEAQAHTTFLAGRSVSPAPAATPGSTTAPARALAAARAQHLALLQQAAASPRATSLSAPWTPLGPAQVLTPAYGPVTGRITALAPDPADPTGNTLYLGTTGGGVWKSTNAAGPLAQVAFTPLTDTLPVFDSSAFSSAIPSLSIGALAIANGVLLAGTGDPNDATDSYYGGGLLRSTDGGLTWTLITRSLDGAAGNHSFVGLGFAGIAFSTTDPTLAVAALTSAAEGDLTNAPTTGSSVRGLYYSSDAGLTWHMATLVDPASAGAQTVQSPSSYGTQGNAATAVVFDPIRQRFYAAVRFHGYYESPDGITWTRLAHQPGTGLTSTACPPSPGATGAASCPIFRGALAVQPVSGDLFALSADSANRDQGLWQDSCARTATGACATATVQFATRLPSTPLESSTGTIPQADYNLALAAAPVYPGTQASDTVLYAATTDLYRCTLAAGCTLRNTTNAQNGCLNPAGVFPSVHALATVSLPSAPLLFLGSDGGLWRSPDGVAETGGQTGSACALTDRAHFDNLNPALGSLAEILAFAQDPADPATALAGLGALGTAGTGNANNSTNAWAQLAPGEGSTVAIDPTSPADWYLSAAAGIHIAHCSRGSACTPADFAASGNQTIGPTQTASDPALIHAPFLLDPDAPATILLGTCRAWRGPATTPAAWSPANLLSRPFGSSTATACASTSPLVRSLAAGGPAATPGAQVLYAGLAGTLTGGQNRGGHLYVNTNASAASATTAWTDTAQANVTNDVADAGIFNPAGFDISSIAADPHDATGATVYATVLGFANNNLNAPHLYRSTDFGAHWTNISANLPNAPASSVVVDPNDANTLYVALDTGVYVTTQVATCASANCWTVLGTALPNAPVTQLAASALLPTGDGRNGLLRAATYGRGLWQIPLLTATLPAVPVIALTPATYDFGPQQIGALPATATFTVTNTGNAPLLVSSVAVSSSTASADYSATTNCTGISIPRNATCSVVVAFSPSRTGTRTGTLTVYGNSAGGQATAVLTGTGTAAAAIVLTPTALTFPQTTLGSTSAVQNLTISNTGGTTATLATPTLTGDFRISANTCTTSLAPQTGCTVSIVFAPTTQGSLSGSFSIASTASSTSATSVATLSGTAVTPPTDTLSPLALAFTPQAIGQASPAQLVTLTNAGDLPLTLIAVSTSSPDFTTAGGCGNSLAAHSACGLQVTFTPHAVGPVISTLTVSDQFRAQTVQLSGTGLAPAGVSLTPLGGLAFGPIGVGVSSAAQLVTLTNNGGVPLAIASIAVTGDYAALTGTNTCGATLAPSAVCTLQVAFTPAATGPRTGAVTVSSSAIGSPHTVALTGTGVDLSLTPTGPTSASITSGQTATYALVLDSPATLSTLASPVNAVTLTCAGVPAHAHALCTINPAAATLGSSNVITVTIATGLLKASLTPSTFPSRRATPTNIPWSTPLLALLLPAGALTLRRRRSRRGPGRSTSPPRYPRLLTLLLPLATLALLAATQGCATGRTIPGTGDTTSTPTGVTPTGTYTLTIAASNSGLVRSVPLTLTIR